MNDVILNLTEALPVANRAFTLRKNFNLSLINSLDYLLDACSEVIKPKLFLLAKDKIKNLDLNYKISGLLSGLHTDLYWAIKYKDEKKVKIIITRLIHDDFQINSKTQEFQYINFSELNSYYQPIIQKIFVADLTGDISFKPLTQDDFENAKGRIQQGFKLIEKSFPDFYQEAAELITEVLILNSQRIRAGSSADLFGMIYRNYSYNLERMADVLDFIIHEQSHLYIHMLANDDPLVLNSEERYESPLREEKRPLIGVYHASFVLARIIYILENALLQAVIPSTEIDYTKSLTAHYRSRFEVGINVLERYAQMSKLGSNLILSASKLIN